MPAYHDFICTECGEITLDLPITVEGKRCLGCRKGQLEIYWMNARPRNAIPLSPADSTVVFEHPETHHIIYPGRNDRPMPDRYQIQGYQKRELRSLHELDRFSKAHGMVNEAAHYNSGNHYDD